MASSTDFKKIHDLYQLNGVSKGISIVHFCQMNGIVYKHYERWYKNYHIVKVVSGKHPIVCKRLINAYFRCGKLDFVSHQ